MNIYMPKKKMEEVKRIVDDMGEGEWGMRGLSVRDKRDVDVGLRLRGVEAAEVEGQALRWIGRLMV